MARRSIVAIYLRQLITTENVGRAIAGDRHHRAQTRRGARRPHGAPRALTALPNRICCASAWTKCWTACAATVSRLCVLCHRSRQFQIGQRHAGPPIRRPAVAVRRRRVYARRCAQRTPSPGSAATNSPSSGRMSSRRRRHALGARLLADLSDPYRYRRPSGDRSAPASAWRSRQATATIRPAAEERRSRALPRQGDGKGAFRFFEAEMDARAQARRKLEMDLRAAMRAERVRGPLPAAGQSRDRRDHRLRGAGALAASRARHDSAGRVHSRRGGDRPDRADRRIGAAQACADAAPWPSDVRVAVNLSPLQFKTGTCSQTVTRRARGSGLPPNRLELEITETLLLREERAGAGDAACAARARCPHFDGRFRHRLFVAELSAQFPVRQDQDRPLVRARPRRQRDFAGDRAGHREPRQSSASPSPPKASRPEPDLAYLKVGRLSRRAGLSVQQGASRHSR